MPAVTLHTLPLAAAAAHGAPARHCRCWPGGSCATAAWDVVQSHERTLGQDVYRAGEGCHRALPRTTPRRSVPRAAITGCCWRSSGACSDARRTSWRSRGEAPGDRRALRRCPGPAERGLQRRRSHPLPSGQPRPPSHGRARRGRRAGRRLHDRLRRQRLSAQGAGDRDPGARRARPIARAGCSVLGKGTAARGLTSRDSSTSPIASSGWDRDRTSSAGTPPPTSWRCPRATSRSATCTSRRSPPASRWSRRPGRAARRRSPRGAAPSSSRRRRGAGRVARVDPERRSACGCAAAAPGGCRALHCGAAGG